LCRQEQPNIAASSRLEDKLQLVFDYDIPLSEEQASEYIKLAGNDAKQDYAMGLLIKDEALQTKLSAQIWTAVSTAKSPPPPHTAAT
jgi:hypothetical protein